MSTRDVEGPVCSHVWAVLVLLWPLLGWLEDREHRSVASLKHRSLVIQKLSRNQPTSKVDWLFPVWCALFQHRCSVCKKCLCFVQRKSHSRFNSKNCTSCNFFHQSDWNLHECSNQVLRDGLLMRYSRSTYQVALCTNGQKLSTGANRWRWR